ncbi:MAG: class I SAM-dependent methyltransferase [Bacteroidales bacterium]|nr:class I SAM-dependent methyltransferase [Bacteroidales bacterium]
MDLIRNRIILLITLLFLFACNPPVDPTSMQPFDGYPYITSKEEIKKTLEDRGIGAIKFKKGEIIADIGAGNGYIEAMLSIFNDSLTFYIQDIDTSVCNQISINEVVDFYQEVNGRPFTNKFIVVNGTDTETNLPDSTFDKILMMRTYQYLKEPRKFIMDVRENLKDNGLFYVINPQYDEYESLSSQRQKYGWNSSPLEKEISDIIDWGFELIQISRNYEGYDQPYIMVFKKRN